MAADAAGEFHPAMALFFFLKQDPQAQLYIESLNIVLEHQPHEGGTHQNQPLQAIASILSLH
jgi:hypothetical protein